MPQGSILCPLVCIIYLNNFTNASNIFQIISYADDSTPLAELIDFNDPNNRKNNDVLLGKELQKSCVWLKINGMLFNSTKSTLKRVKYPQLKFNNNLQCIDNFIFCGLPLNKHQVLGWSCEQNFNWNMLKLLGLGKISVATEYFINHLKFTYIISTWLLSTCMGTQIKTCM